MNKKRKYREIPETLRQPNLTKGLKQMEETDFF